MQLHFGFCTAVVVAAGARPTSLSVLGFFVSSLSVGAEADACADAATVAVAMGTAPGGGGGGGVLSDWAGGGAGPADLVASGCAQAAATSEMARSEERRRKELTREAYPKSRTTASL